MVVSSCSSLPADGIQVALQEIELLIGILKNKIIKLIKYISSNLMYNKIIINSLLRPIVSMQNSDNSHTYKL